MVEHITSLILRTFLTNDTLSQFILSEKIFKHKFKIIYF